MTRDIWFTSDLHLGHANIIKYCDRPWWKFDPSADRVPDPDAMNEALIEAHNKYVKPKDKCYNLGDVYFHNKKSENVIDALLSRMQGEKVLLLGNNDDGKDPVLQKHFKRIYGSFRMMPELGLMLSHVPQHPSAQFRGPGKAYLANVHGHIHSNPSPIDKDVKYVNICVEWTNYRPVHLDELLALVKK